MSVLSVIIPCYNVKAYIDRCMESVMGQTLKIENLEIILVNDASTDDTLDKLYEWEKRFPEQVMVVSYNENLRQGGARNIGLKYATGEYVCFVDADDWLELDALEKLYKKIVACKCQMVSGRFIRETYPGQKDISIESGEKGSICTGIYRKDVILENDVWFPEGVAYEDNYWSAILNIYLEDTCEIDDIVYHYFVNSQSTVTGRGMTHHFDRLDIELAIIEEYKARGVFDTYKEKLEAQFVQRFYLNSLYIFFTRFEEIPPILEDMRKAVWKYFPNYKENSYFNTCNAREQVLLRLLEIQRELSEEEWMRIKIAYLKTLLGE